MISIGLTPSSRYAIRDSSHRDIGVISMALQWRMIEAIPTASTSSTAIPPTLDNNPDNNNNSMSEAERLARLPPGPSPRTAMAQLLRGERPNQPKLQSQAASRAVATGGAAPSSTASAGRGGGRGSVGSGNAQMGSRGIGAGSVVNSSFDSDIAEWKASHAGTTTASATTPTTQQGGGGRGRPIVPPLNTAGVPGYAGAPSSTLPSSITENDHDEDDDNDEAHNSWDE
jgi:hypothetical protein